MDQIALVENQLDEGQRLIYQLVHDGFDIAAAFWLKTSEEARWFLYVASKVVDEEGPAPAYRAVYASLQRLKDPWMSLSEIKLIGVSNPMARDVLKLYRRHPGRMPTRYNGTQLGGVGIEEAYIYPQPLHEKKAQLSWERRRLKTPVKQKVGMDALLEPFDERDKKAFERLVASGLSPAQAEFWVRNRREHQPKPTIPAGTIVKAQVAAWWGENPEDDPNPLLLVEAPDGAQGLTFKDNTEPA